MPGFMHKTAVYLGLVEDDDRYEDYDDDDEVVAEAPRRSREVGGLGTAPEHGRAPAAVREEHRVTALPERRAAAPVATAVPTRSEYRITTIHPRTYNEAKQIGEAFRSGTPVIMNLTDMVDADAKRLVDFAAGLIFGLHGSIERVTSKVFLLSPADVVVTAEDKARIAESGFFNQS